MATSSNATRRTIGDILQQGTQEEIIRKIRPMTPSEQPLAPEIPETRGWSKGATEARRAFLKTRLSAVLDYLSGEPDTDEHENLRGNIENFIGMTRVPTGVIGPLRVNGIYAKGDFYVPMATSEGALVASYHRGAMMSSQAGGITSVCLTELVQRSPVFKFRNFGECGAFLIWVMQQRESFGPIVGAVSGHAHLVEVRPNIDGNQVTLVLEYTTGDAAGQNMVTICTNAICNHIIEYSPIKPRIWYVEGNLSGDKKATSLSLTSVRGKKVTAEVMIPENLIHKCLRTTPAAMLEYWKITLLNGIQSGSIGVNGQFANGLTALFLACGQDVACAVEASAGSTRFDITDDGGLYACVTLPNLIVGTVGGGTGLPTQHECLSMLGCAGTGGARKFAEICAATILCGELSIVGAMASGTFARAHTLFGRKRESNATPMESSPR